VLPDIGVFGPYTYLVTELAFGAVALVLLAHSGAWRRAAKTVAVLYPIAYVWDWYTLEVGVFAIELRTGVELLGIPIEEHVFILLIPTFVVAVHETLHGTPDGTGLFDARADAGDPAEADD
jgi:lycopene cyclase domain-containing protein